MADPSATLRGILEKNISAAADETSGYHLNHVTIELDVSEAGPLDENLEGLPISVEGRFEVREHPQSGARWVFRVSSIQADVAGGGPPLSAPPPA
jgi:hypothetical protein